jgi:hypothetical protein
LHNLATFHSQDFIDDIENVFNYLFSKAQEENDAGRNLKSKIENWFNAFPAIGTLIT